MMSTMLSGQLSTSKTKLASLKLTGHLQGENQRDPGGSAQDQRPAEARGQGGRQSEEGVAAAEDVSPRPGELWLVESWSRDHDSHL